MHNVNLSLMHKTISDESVVSLNRGNSRYVTTSAYRTLAAAASDRFISCRHHHHHRQQQQQQQQPMIDKSKESRLTDANVTSTSANKPHMF